MVGVSGRLALVPNPHFSLLSNSAHGFLRHATEPWAFSFLFSSLGHVMQVLIHLVVLALVAAQLYCWLMAS